MSSTNLSSNHSLGVLGVRAVQLEQDFIRRYLQQNEFTKFGLTSHEESNSLITMHEPEKGRRSAIFNTPNIGASVSDQEQSPIDDSPTSSICSAPICRQFWKAGNYDDRPNSKRSYVTNHLRIHPKFLHSNATSHKWVFGAMAELLDNSVDEIRNGATFVIVDKTTNPRDGTPALLIQDDGGGMDPEAIRRCLSFGFSDNNSQNAIGKYGNGFKTSSMRLGADVVVFSRCTRDRRLTQSVGLLSYTFLMQTRQDKIVVPMVDYQFDTVTGIWNTLHDEQHLKNNLSILLQWSLVATEAELLKQFDDIGPHGTKIIVYNLWHDDEGKMELDFDSDLEDIRISGKGNNTAKITSPMEAKDQHLAKRLHYSLRAYLSILYMRVPVNFCILLRGRVVEYHNIANALKFPEFIGYHPYKVEDSIITTIGFLKEAPAVNIHGFNVYHKNRLILPFWNVSYSKYSGRGVVGVLEANFIEPTHNKQDFEKTQLFQKLEHRLKQMTVEYWQYHCELIGYQPRKRTRARRISHAASDSGLGYVANQPVFLGKDSGSFDTKASFAAGTCGREVSGSSNQVAVISKMSLPSTHQNTQGATLKRKEHDNIVELECVKRIGVLRSRTFDSGRGGDYRCQEYEKADEELNLKITRLTEEVREAQQECICLLLESALLEKVKKEIRELIRPV